MSASAAGHNPGRLAARLGILTTMLLWGSQYPITYDLADRWDPFTIILIRLPPAILLLWLLESLWWRERRAQAPVPLRRKALLGAAMATFSVLFTVAISIGNPVTIAVIAAMAPAMASLVSWLVLRERPSRSVFLGLLCVIPGALMATVDFSVAAGPRPADLLGALLLLVAHTCWGWYSLMAQRWLRGYPQTAITGRSLRWALPFLVLAYLVAFAAGETHADWLSSPAFDALAFALLTLGALVAGTVFWNLAVARLGLAVTALHLNLIPIIAILVAAVLGVLPSAQQLAGAGLVIAGIVIGQRPQWSRMRSSVSPDRR